MPGGFELERGTHVIVPRTTTRVILQTLTRAMRRNCGEAIAGPENKTSKKEGYKDSRKFRSKSGGSISR
ncbi:hypothetical protein KPH14_008953 [Odynerus spinipes]|uniref:Uncharacterized protein n=1 Tax=Odynerus spinipes TaxID=1348599 RepID=A0AAD9RPB9_9HYME|nr:hypothetical protein KPH14_008953 [Odynerus spinipes]